MSRFSYRDGVLSAERVPLTEIAAAVGTPFYCYSSAALTEAYDEFAAAVADLPATICYALKANGNQAVIATLARRGAGADVVSGGELRRALRAGVPTRKIVFAGVGKTPAELAQGLAAGILQFNVESLPELAELNQVALAAGRRATVALRINPDVDARTHAKITTGKAENKFGIAWEQARAAYREAAAMPGLDVAGIGIHIGSQLTGLEPFRAAFGRVAELTRTLRGDGHDIRRLDLGGGLGIAYRGEERPPLDGYAALAREAVAGLGCELVFEPGRRLVGEAGVLVARVVYVKQGSGRRFVILDAGMNDLLRPALYDAYHPLLPVRQPAADAALAAADVVGPICESADCFAVARPLPPLAAGDLVAFAAAGAYGAVMASSYNARPLPAEILVRGRDFAVVRERPDIDMIIDQDRLPGWLGEGEVRAEVA
jgi:diaminopimelate decarboxylase